MSWSVQSHKKSMYASISRPLTARLGILTRNHRNFGIVKHPGSGATTLASSTTDDTHGEATTPHAISEGKSGRLPRRETTAQDLLASKGFIAIKWCGKCEAEKVSMGTFDVQLGQGGMYGLVFDNTFSKQTSKTATFVVLTYPTGAPPQTTNHLPNLQLPQHRGSQTSLGKHAAQLDGVASQSSESLQSHTPGGRPTSVRSDTGGHTNYHVGTLSKRRRKKGQGYARRFFSLDYSTCTLAYYHNRNSSALRGAIPLSLAAVAADERRREISIDSGAEIWHLRAPNDKEFQDWARALEKASRIARGIQSAPFSGHNKSKLTVDTRTGDLLLPSRASGHDTDREWQQVESLVSRVVGSRDALRRLTKDMAGPVNPANQNPFSPPFHSASSEERGDSYFPALTERRSFWGRRKSTLPNTAPGPNQASSAALAVPVPNSVAAIMPANGSVSSTQLPRGQKQGEGSFHDHCQELLADLDSVVSEFTTLIKNSKRRRTPMPPSAGGLSRKSTETSSTADEFFDAEDARSAVLKIGGSDDESEPEDDVASMHETSSISSAEDDHDGAAGDVGHLFPTRPKSLVPLPLDQEVRRRTTIPPATVAPPSLIAFVRKNVGKDLSTISMPVSANEPISILQKTAEQLEYAQLLNEAVQQKTATERLLYVTAFAVSQFSGHRAKERAIRKPFTPLLGETFELVRTDDEVPGGFRLLVEKVQHRPLRLAMQADSANWSFSQSPAPGQKFWGKSAEVTTDGRVRIALRLPDGSDELYSWNIATMFLRNVVMGEKYVEPVGTMHVLNDSTGHKAAVEFKSKGMFGGRVEEVHVVAYSPDGSNTGSGLTGNWTSELKTVGPGKAASYEIWRAGKLVDNSTNTYGMTVFAAGLNEITAVEKDKLAPTDCRLRPDQRLAELGNLDEAEEWKQRLEEAQRSRRRDLEERGESYKPKWFVMAEDSPEGEEVWKIKGGKDGYWEERARGGWGGVENLFDV